MLTVPQETDVQILEGAEVSTTRRGTPTPITFTTDDDLTLVSVTVNGLLSQPNGGAFSIINPSLGVGADLAAFSQVPIPGDAIYFGLSKPAAHWRRSLATSAHF
jgi:hypothetical protein